MLQWREAEVQHGRVAMLAVLGMLCTEEPIEYHPLFESYNKDIGPAIRHLDEVDAVSPFFLFGKYHSCICMYDMTPQYSYECTHVILIRIYMSSLSYKLGLVILIGSLEYNRALQAFAKPEGEFSFQQLNEDHYPGKFALVLFVVCEFMYSI